MKRTKREIPTATRGGLPFTIPKGAPVQLATPGPADKEPRYWVNPIAFRQGTLEHHDATYYGIDVKADDVEDAYRTIQPGEPMYEMVEALKAEGQWVCDSSDHNGPGNCSNPECFKHSE